jgi:hypothetical protein
MEPAVTWFLLADHLQIHPAAVAPDGMGAALDRGEAELRH